MLITVNGKAHALESPLALDRLLKKLGIDPKAVAVERNREIVPRDRLGAVQVKAGDVIEIIRLVGGG